MSSKRGKIIHIKILPYLYGKDYAISFIDDTDLSTRENTELVYDLLKKHGIMGTKTIWVWKARRNSTFRRNEEVTVQPGLQDGSALDEEDYLDFILRLKENGFEIALHNIAAGNSYRHEIIEGIKKYRELLGEYPKNNAFHERNIENLYAGNDKLSCLPFKMLERLIDRSEYQGHVENSPYYWGDISNEYIKYMRLPFHTICETNTLKVNPSMPFHDPNRPYVNYWYSCSDGADCSRFNKLLSPDNIKRLEQENGACIVYTHYAKGFCKKKSGTFILNDEFVDTIMNMHSHTNAWYPTVSELLDRLLLCKYISVNTIDQGICVKNRGTEEIKNLTIIFRPDADDVYVEGNKDNIHRISKEKVTIHSLPTETAVYFKFDRNTEIRIKNNESKALRRERMAIECYNYYGMLKNELLPKLKENVNTFTTKLNITR